MTAATHQMTGETLVDPRSTQAEPVTELVPEPRESIDNVTAMPGVRLVLKVPSMEDPNLSDNPDLVQARNSYRLAHYRLAEARGYADGFIEQLRDELADATVALMTAGGKLAVDGSIID